MKCCHVVGYAVLVFDGGCLGRCSLGLCKLFAGVELGLSRWIGLRCKVHLL